MADFVSEDVAQQIATAQGISATKTCNSLIVDV